jgi:hypothetical protein
MPPACFRRKALEGPVPDGDDVGMDDLTNYRLDEADKRADRAEGRFDRIDAALMDIKLQLAKTATRGELYGAIATMIGAGLGLLGVIVAILAYLQVLPRPH